MENIQTRVVEFLEEVIKESEWVTAKVELAKHLIVATQLVCAKHLGVEFGFKLGYTSRDDSTLSRYFTTPEEIENLKERTMGSGLTKYFKTSNPTVSKEIKFEQQLEYGTTVEFDADMTLILKLKNLPEDLAKLKIELNKTAFMNPENQFISARPDATCIIDGLVCPVELMTSKKALRMLEFSARSRGSRSTNSGYEDVIENIKSAVLKDENQRLSIKERRASTKMLRRNTKERSRTLSKANKKIDKDLDYDPTKRGCRKKKHIKATLQGISMPTDAEKKAIQYENRSKSQKKRRFMEHITFVNNLNIEKRPAHLIDKIQQLYIQMYAMCVSKGLLMYWSDDNIYFMVLSMSAVALENVARVSSNYSAWCSSR